METGTTDGKCMIKLITFIGHCLYQNECFLKTLLAGILLLPYTSCLSPPYNLAMVGPYSQTIMHPCLSTVGPLY